MVRARLRARPLRHRRRARQVAPAEFKKKNVDFVSQVEAAIPNKKTKIILACIWGGSLVREPPKNRGLTDDTKGAGAFRERLSSIRLGTPTCTTCTEA